MGSLHPACDTMLVDVGNKMKYAAMNVEQTQHLVACSGFWQSVKLLNG